MNLVIFGGSFNPIHLGHLHLAEEVRKTFSCETVVFVPAAIPPHKPDARLADPIKRLRMLTLATIRSDFIVDDCEIRRGGVSYTIDTVRDIIDRYKPKEKPGLLIGDDLVEGYPQWKDPDLLAEIAHLIIARRTDTPLQSFPYDHTEIHNLLIPISSRDIRKRIKADEAYRFLLPSEVYDYIEAHELYR
ncbi:MAG: nicotinate (nicotinamide) nucleotide adenylyltransferase [Spirochaetales bacterium]|nr:nicotinate (nicotinamide) nucleotide adenylyltransferase [Spirochaetales bacterium]